MTAQPIPLFPPGAGTPQELYQRSADAALAFSDRLRAGGHVRFPWPSVDRFVDVLLGGWLVVVGGRAKGGKSTLLRECFEYWVTECRKRVCFVGTEQEASILRLLLAAVRIGAPTVAVFNPEHPMHTKILYDVMQTQAKDAERAIIVADAGLTMDSFTQWARYAYREGCDVLMLDHFHRLAADSKDRYGSRGDAIREIKTMAQKSKMLIMAAAQMKQGEGGHLLGEHEVPGPGSWAETAGLRREADVAIQVWRPFRPGITRKQKQGARDNEMAVAKLTEPNVMACRLDAHRYSEHQTGACRLFVQHGRISSWSGTATDRPSPERGEDQAHA